MISQRVILQIDISRLTQSIERNEREIRERRTTLSELEDALAEKEAELHALGSVVMMHGLADGP